MTSGGTPAEAAWDLSSHDLYKALCLLTKVSEGLFVRAHTNERDGIRGNCQGAWEALVLKYLNKTKEVDVLYSNAFKKLKCPPDNTPTSTS